MIVLLKFENKLNFHYFCGTKFGPIVQGIPACRQAGNSGFLKWKKENIQYMLFKVNRMDAYTLVLARMLSKGLNGITRVKRHLPGDIDHGS